MSTNNILDVPAGNPNVRRVTWPTLANGDAGQIIGPDFALWSDRSIQITGIFGTSGTIVFEGSNDGVNFYTLNAPQGTALQFTSATLRQVLEAALYVRPRVTAGDVTTNLAVTLMLRLPTQRLG
ncbi:hypothetical protein [Paraburkholderia youngii]|uniref:hypothetical protein n=1 Tax=Paraburkholderia youngii TaxID=2782701 RepID=UPI0015910294|nr:hypothetical protein [Paraburkholderia youngii]NUX58665.1 hypothetical protein [Paraburkholderia youngii]